MGISWGWGEVHYSSQHKDRGTGRQEGTEQGKWTGGQGQGKAVLLLCSPWGLDHTGYWVGPETFHGVGGWGGGGRSEVPAGGGQAAVVCTGRGGACSEAHGLWSLGGAFRNLRAAERHRPVGRGLAWPREGLPPHVVLQGEHQTGQVEPRAGESIGQGRWSSPTAPPPPPQRADAAPPGKEGSCWLSLLTTGRPLITCSEVSRAQWGLSSCPMPGAPGPHSHRSDLSPSDSVFPCWALPGDPPPCVATTSLQAGPSRDEPLPPPHLQLRVRGLRPPSCWPTPTSSAHFGAFSLAVLSLGLDACP